MEDVKKAWSELVTAMYKASDRTSNADIDIFNTHAASVNNAVSWFLTYHETKR